MNSNIALEDQFDAANVRRPAGNIQEAVHGLASKKHYAPALDGLRAICIIFTILYHMPGCPSFINGTIGVDIFFALSGWLITWLLLEEQGHRAGGLNLRAFYIRRVFRIMPVYYVTIMLYVIATLVLSRMSGDTEKIDNLGVAIGYLLTFNREYAPPGAGTFISHAWTLGIEEKFYLIWPAILFVFARSALKTFAVSAALIVTTVVVFGSHHLVLRGYLGLGFGAALAFWSYYNHGVRKTFERYPIASLAALALAVPYTLSLNSSAYGWNICISAISSDCQYLATAKSASSESSVASTAAVARHPYFFDLYVARPLHESRPCLICKASCFSNGGSIFYMHLRRFGAGLLACK